MKRAKSADEFFRDVEQWSAELKSLRELLTASDLTEEIKWGGPCYTYKGKNVVGVGSFKSYFGLWFHQGALLKDSGKVLINAQEGKTRAMRQWRMYSKKDIKPAIIKRYLKEAIGHVDAGHEIKANRNRPVEVPQELKNALRKQKGATAAFRDLRVGLQREYAEYIASAKQDKTKQSRIEKVLPMITAGKGLNDRYRS